MPSDPDLRALARELITLAYPPPSDTRVDEPPSSIELADHALGRLAAHLELEGYAIGGSVIAWAAGYWRDAQAEGDRLQDELDAARDQLAEEERAHADVADELVDLRQRIRDVFRRGGEPGDQLLQIAELVDNEGD